MWMAFQCFFNAIKTCITKSHFLFLCLLLVWLQTGSIKSHSYFWVSVCGASESHQEVYFYSYSSAHMLFLVWYQEYSLQECLGNTMTLLRLRSKEPSMGIGPSALPEGQSLPLSSRALHQFCGCLKLWLTYPWRTILIRTLEYHFCCTDPGA